MMVWLEPRHYTQKLQKGYDELQLQNAAPEHRITLWLEPQRYSQTRAFADLEKHDLLAFGHMRRPQKENRVS